MPTSYSDPIYVRKGIEDLPLTKTILEALNKANVESQPLMDSGSAVGLILGRGKKLLTESSRSSRYTDMEAYRKDGGRVLRLNVLEHRTGNQVYDISMFEDIDPDQTTVFVNLDEYIGQIQAAAVDSYYPITICIDLRGKSVQPLILLQLAKTLIEAASSLKNVKLHLWIDPENVDILKEIKHSKRVNIAFSVLSDADLLVEALKKCIAWNYPYVLDYDPIIPTADWEKNLQVTLERLEPYQTNLLRLFTIGCVRVSQVDLALFQGVNPALGHEFVSSPDRLFRLIADERTKLYKSALHILLVNFGSVAYQINGEERPIAENLLLGLHTGAFAVMDLCGDGFAIKVLKKFIGSSREFKWEDVFSSRISGCKNENMVGDPVKLVASVSSISEPKGEEIGGGQRVTASTIIIQDKYGDEIECLSFPVGMHPNIERYFERHVDCVVTGTIVPVDVTYKFFLLNIEDRVTAEDLILVREEPSERIQSIFSAAAQTTGGIVEYIKQQLITNLNVKGLGHAQELDRSIDFMIYQSFSEGREKNKSLKLHSLVIGSPATGKSFLTTIAKILNPVSEEVSGNKLTLAGLIGDVSSRKGKRTSNPGYLARASRGVFCIQDFHDMKGGDRQQVLAQFSKVMEDGEVIDATSARWVHEALTSIHLDMNRLSQVNRGKTYDTFSDIDVPTNILSRFDFVTDIPRDAQRQIEIALSSLSEGVSLSSFGSPESDRQWERDLKRIVAYVRTYWNKVEIPDQVTQHIAKRLKASYSAIQQTDQGSEAFSDMIMRLTKSYHKYIKAIVAAHLRTKATIDDVDLAATFVEEKLRFLASLEGGETTKPLSAKDARQKFIRARFAGQTTDAQEVLRVVNEEFSREVAQATIYRDLGEIARSAGTKKFTIPDSNEAGK